MERDELLLRSRLALEAAEGAVSELRELAPADPELSELQGDLRAMCDRVESVQLDRAIAEVRERELAIAR